MRPAELLSDALAPHLSDEGRAALEGAVSEVAGGVTSTRFGSLLSALSRHVKPRPLAPTAAQVERGLELVPDWSIERWNTLEAARVITILARPDLADASAAEAIEDAFKFADDGETCALAKALPLLPSPERFAWRAGECCRSNMLTVFESAACDSPFAARWFDDVAWKQAVVKALFVGAPLWRIRGLDGRLDEDLARMVLDLVDERRSAGRAIPVDLWLCLGEHAGERAERALESELAGAGPAQRAAVGVAFARRGDLARAAALADAEEHPVAAQVLRAASQGGAGQELHRKLADPSLVAAPA